MSQLSTSLPYDQMLTKWSSVLNPMIANPLNNASILTNVNLKNGVTVINHRLGQTMQGWFLIDIQGPATIYRSAPFNDKTLSLTSDAEVTVSIGVF